MTDDNQAEPFSGDERRFHDRSRLIVDVHFEGGESTGVASSKDISPGGLYMSTQTDIPVGSTLALRIPLAGNHVVVKGEVVFANPGEGLGVRFRDLSEDARRTLEQERPQT
jgi:PilZ domain-containing protein